jgi:hypothetical protein
MATVELTKDQIEHILTMFGVVDGEYGYPKGEELELRTQLEELLTAASQRIREEEYPREPEPMDPNYCCQRFKDALSTCSGAIDCARWGEWFLTAHELSRGTVNAVAHFPISFCPFCGKRFDGV